MVKYYKMSSLTPPPNLSLVIATSSLQSALDKLLQNDFSALDLPIDPTDSMWERLEKDFQLTLGQLSALRNYVKTSSISITHSPTSSALMRYQLAKWYHLLKLPVLVVERLVKRKLKSIKTTKLKPNGKKKGRK